MPCFAGGSLENGTTGSVPPVVVVVVVVHVIVAVVVIVVVVVVAIVAVIVVAIAIVIVVIVVVVAIVVVAVITIATAAVQVIQTTRTVVSTACQGRVFQTGLLREIVHTGTIGGRASAHIVVSVGLSRGLQGTAGRLVGVAVAGDCDKGGRGSRHGTNDQSNESNAGNLHGFFQRHRRITRLERVLVG